MRQELTRATPTLSNSQSEAIARGFGKAEKVMTENLPISDTEGKPGIDVEKIVIQFLEPSPATQGLIFFLVLSVLGIFKFFLAFSGGVYGQILKLMTPSGRPYDDHEGSGRGKKEEHT